MDALEQTDTTMVVALVQAMARAVAGKADELSRLDAVAGDGDHGAGLARALGAAAAELAHRPPASPAEALRRSGSTLMETMGGAAGLLFGTIFMAAARRAGDRTTLTADVWAAMLAEGLAGVQARGHAQPGERTMVDALSPAVASFRAAATGGLTLPEAFEHAATAAEQGARATAAMVPRQGRARFVGDRSLGQPDAGATSLALMLRAAATVLAVQPPGGGP